MDNSANPYEGEVEDILENYVFPRYTKTGGREVKQQEVENLVAAMEEYGVEDGTSVAEVGGGPGINVNLVQEFYDDRGVDLDTYAVDISDGMVKTADALDNADHVMRGDAYNLPIQDVDVLFAGRLAHLLPDLESAVEEFAETADYVVFDYFRDASGRKFYNDVMGDLNDNMPDNSRLHTDEEIIETVEQFGDVQYHDTDFWLPFGAVRNIESDSAMKAANWVQERTSGRENNVLHDAAPLWDMVDQQTRETVESMAEGATMALTGMDREELEEWKQRATENDDSVGYIGFDTSEF